MEEIQVVLLSFSQRLSCTRLLEIIVASNIFIKNFVEIGSSFCLFGPLWSKDGLTLVARHQYLQTLSCQPPAEKVGGAQQPNIKSKMMQNKNNKYGRRGNHTKDRTGTVF